MLSSLAASQTSQLQDIPHAAPPPGERLRVAERLPADGSKYIDPPSSSKPAPSPQPKGPVSPTKPPTGIFRFLSWAEAMAVVAGAIAGAALGNTIIRRQSDIEAAMNPSQAPDLTRLAKRIVTLCQTEGVEAGIEAFLDLYNFFEMQPGLAGEWQAQVEQAFSGVKDARYIFDPYALIQELAHARHDSTIAPDDYLQWLREQDPDQYHYFFLGAAMMESDQDQSRLCPELWKIKDVPAMYDPYGTFSEMVIYDLEKRGAQSWRQPLQSLALYSTRRDSEIASGQVPTTGPLIVPRRMGELQRPRIPLQFIIPTSEFLHLYFNPTVARSLNRCAVVVNATKGLMSDGKTPRDYIQETLRSAGRSSVPTISVYGYAASSSWTDIDKRRIVLATDNVPRAFELAQRWIGHVQEPIAKKVRGVDTWVFERKHRRPSVRIVVVSDPHVVRANELASVYKNLMAIELGMELFNEMARIAQDGSLLKNKRPAAYLHDFYLEKMKRAKEDILSAIKAEGISDPIILEEVEDDMKRSWALKGNTEAERLTALSALYHVVDTAFGKDSDSNGKQKDAKEMKAKLAPEVAKYYSVRNPRYGFLLAAEAREGGKRVFIPNTLVAEGVQIAQTFIHRPHSDRFPPSFRNTARIINERLWLHP